MERKNEAVKLRSKIIFAEKTQLGRIVPELKLWTGIRQEFLH